MDFSHARNRTLHQALTELPFHTPGNHEVRRNETFTNIVTLTTFWGTRVPVDGSEEPMMLQFSDLPLIGRMKNQRLIRYASLASRKRDVDKAIYP